MLRSYGALIVSVAAAVDEPERRPLMEETLDHVVKPHRPNLVAALLHVLDGERDESLLCDSLDYEDALIIRTVLQGIADYDMLEEFLVPLMGNCDSTVGGEM
jgi:hypothetical protein